MEPVNGLRFYEIRLDFRILALDWGRDHTSPEPSGQLKPNEVEMSKRRANKSTIPCSTRHKDLAYLS